MVTQERWWGESLNHSLSSFPSWCWLVCGKLVQQWEVIGHMQKEVGKDNVSMHAIECLISDHGRCTVSRTLVALLEVGPHCLLMDFPDPGFYLSTCPLMIAHCQTSQILIATCMDYLLLTPLHSPPTTPIIGLFDSWVLVMSMPNRQSMIMPASPLIH